MAAPAASQLWASAPAHTAFRSVPLRQSAANRSCASGEHSTPSFTGFATDGKSRSFFIKGGGSSARFDQSGQGDGRAVQGEQGIEIAQAAVDLMPFAEDATAVGNPQAASDGVSGAAHLYCAALCAIANVEINAASLKDQGRRTALLDTVASLRGRADQSVREAQTAFQLRLSS